MKKIIRLTEDDLEKIVKKVIKEQQASAPVSKDMQANVFKGKDGKLYLNFQSEMGQKYKPYGPIKNFNLPKGTFMVTNKNGVLYAGNIKIEKA